MFLHSLTSFRVIPKNSLGIDVGTSSLKLVELSAWGGRVHLRNYGDIQASVVYGKPYRSFEKNTLLLASRDIARAIQAVMQDAKVQARRAIFAIPDFSTFFTTFDLPPMTKDELPAAIEFEARKHIPLPLSEVTFDWQLVGKRFDAKKPVRILLVAVPNEVINQYQEVARLAAVELVALEVEVFGLLRAALKEDKRPVALLDIGAQSTTISIAHEGLLRNSYSLDIGGNAFTEQIARSTSIEYADAEKEKKEKDMLTSAGEKSVLLPYLDNMIEEVRKASQAFTKREEKEIEKIILGGGSANLPGLVEYFKKQLGKETEIVNPFREVYYPPVLEESLKEMRAPFVIAVGMALRGLN